MLISLIPSVSSQGLPLQNILVPETNPTEKNDGAYGALGTNKLNGIGYTLPSNTSGTGYWYINTVNAYFSCGGANTQVKCIIVNENKTIVGISNIFVSENITLAWYQFTFNSAPAMEANKMYYFGLIVATGGEVYLHQKLSSYGEYSDFIDLTNDFTNPTNPTDGTYYGTGDWAIYITVSNFASKAYSYIYEPNSINSGSNTVWAYDYSVESYGVNCYTPIGLPIIYTGSVFNGGLKTGNGTFTVNKTPFSATNANQWQIGIYTEATNGTVTNGVFTFGFDARSSSGYEGVQIIVNITSPSMMNPIYTIHHNFKWGADSNGNIAPTPIGGGGSGTGTIDSIVPIFVTIFGNIYNDVVFIIFGVVCGLLTWKFAMTGLIAGIGISTLLCTMAGILPIWAVGLCIVLDITLIVLGSGLLNRTSNKNVGT